MSVANTSFISTSTLRKALDFTVSSYSTALPIVHKYTGSLTNGLSVLGSCKGLTVSTASDRCVLRTETNASVVAGQVACAHVSDTRLKGTPGPVNTAVTADEEHTKLRINKTNRIRQTGSVDCCHWLSERHMGEAGLVAGNLARLLRVAGARRP